MRRCTIVLLIFFYIPIVMQGQASFVRYKSGYFIPNQKLELHQYPDSTIYEGYAYVFLQFGKHPSLSEFRARGISFIHFIPENTYFCAVPTSITPSTLYGTGVHAIWGWQRKMKISESAASLILAPNTGKVSLYVQFVQSIDWDKFKRQLQKQGIAILDESKLRYGLVKLEIPKDKLEFFLDLPIVTWVEALSPPPEAIRYRAIGTERVAPLHYFGGEHLRGKGMVIGVGDNGKIGHHIDFGSRVTTFSKYGTGTHATHVTGIITGYPNLNPREGIGTAPDARIVTSYFSDILDRTPDFIRDYGMLITNNSYGISGGNCNNAGDYSLLAVYIDDLQNQYDSLIHVFAAGNNGGWTCSPYPAHFATISNGWQCAKSTFTIGACNHLNSLASYSSRGPTDDGRIKPEIVAVGNDVRSTRPNNTYGGGGGTSYSSPAMTGITTLMYEKYKRQHNHFPPATLIKALLCNAADDKGLSGPDYQWGYGRVNAARAIRDLDKSHYFSGDLSDGDSVSYSLQVPTNAENLKVMVMWRDPTAAPYAAPTLVNDIDMTVEDPSSSLFEPWILDPSPSKVNTVAIRGKDHLNPQEQVTINNPASGVYTVKLKGYRVPFGPQKYYLVYSYDTSGITVQYPNGGETWVPGETEYIRWDAIGQGNETFDIDQSVDSGATWTPLVSGLSSATRNYTWTVSGSATQALIRVKTASLSDQSDFTFQIMGTPVNLTVNSPCESYIQLTWDTVPDADYYGIYRMGKDTMTLWDTTSAVEYLTGGWSQDTTYWWSVASVDSLQKPGRRATALSITPSTGSCNWSNDLSVYEMVTPVFSRENTSEALPSVTHLSLALRNAGNNPIDTFTVNYQIDGGPVVSQSIRDTIQPNDTTHFIFTNTENFVPGEYQLVFWTELAGDDHPDNDTLREILRVIANDPVTLPYTEDFEGADSLLILGSFSGLGGLDEWDYQNTSGPGRLRSFAGQGFVQEGKRAITLDANVYGSYAVNKLILTLNMSNYDTSSNDIRLQFDYMHHEVTSVDNPNDRVWVRGSDTSSWTEIYNLFDHQGERGQYNLVHTGLSITNSLKTAGQNYSSSFQIRFGQEGNAAAVETTAEDGYSFDNIKIVEVSEDLELQEVLHPGNIGCGLGVEYPAIRIHNNASNDATSIEAHYRINNGAVVSDTIPLIAGETTLDYTFSTGYDFSSLGDYRMDVWVDYPPDNFSENDSINQYLIRHLPKIDSFPYLEGFEGLVQGWSTGGTASSWELGTPASGIISEAAKGKMAWVTNLTGDYNNDEFSYLYSPCFDLSGLQTPMLSFAYIYEIENNYDYGWVEYSTDGNTWTKLGAKGQGVNWYNDNKDAWDDVNGHWHVATIEVPVTDTSTMFRWVLQTDVGLRMEGMGLDQVTLYEHDTIYDATNIDTIVRSVSGNNWVPIDSNSQHILSIHPKGQNLGNARVSLFKYTGVQRYDENAYYGSRSFVIHVDSTPLSPVDLRIYFTDAEIETLRSASNCTHCIALSDAFHIEIKKYTSISEDSIPTNNTGGTTRWISFDSIQVLPFENGYYASFSVDSFSEIWITSPKLEYVDSIAIPIRQASDDAEEHKQTGSVNPYSKTIELTKDIDDQVVGLRFDDIRIPAGSFIEKAWIQFRSVDTTSHTDTVYIQIENSTNAPTYNTGNYNISTRNAWSDIRKWYVPAWPQKEEAGSAQRSPDIRSLVQTITDMPGWNPGNALSILLEGNGTHKAYALDSVPQYAARLHIVYDSVCRINHVIYVDRTATGFQDGSSWENAFRSLTDAIDLANQCPDAREIWLREGTYYPTDGLSRSSSFNLTSGVKIYGGFAGTETSRSQRDILAHPGILSGDIGITGDSLDNVFHVVVASAGVDTALLDGISIRHGTANGTNLGENSGGGIINTGLLHLKDVKIDYCGAALHASGIHNKGTGAILQIIGSEIGSSSSSDDSSLYNEAGGLLIFKGQNIINK